MHCSSAAGEAFLPTRLIVPLVGTDKKASQKITAYNNRYCSTLQKLDQRWCERCGASLQMRSVADGQREIQKMLILHNVGQRTILVNVVS